MQKIISNLKLSCLVVFPLLVSCASCDKSNEIENDIVNNPIQEEVFFLGADLSYVNEMIDCGAIYKDANNNIKNPYTIFEEAGTNLVRLRLWHNPTWTNYSNFNDVKNAILESKRRQMKVLLDFHYSDTWADPDSQEIPAAWLSDINNTDSLGNLLYNYTYTVLNDLADENLLPEIVQIGNEINGMILQQGALEWPIDWERNSHLINKGIQAVRDISTSHNTPVEVMLHIAQPENGLWWFEQATANGITDFDWIGLSYYPLWSEYSLEQVQAPLENLINTYQKRLMIVETAYPFTLENNDPANNILDSNALINGYPASQEGQLNYLLDLKNIILNAGGEGIIYWEPAWVSTNCSTLWGQGSHWDNATLFDHSGKATLGMQLYNQ
jgi:arabinogalactan endo-1,4-beta-galactosidase